MPTLCVNGGSSNRADAARSESGLLVARRGHNKSSQCQHSRFRLQDRNYSKGLLVSQTVDKTSVDITGPLEQLISSYWGSFPESLLTFKSSVDGLDTESNRRGPFGPLQSTVNCAAQSRPVSLVPIKSRIMVRTRRAMLRQYYHADRIDPYQSAETCQSRRHIAEGEILNGTPTRTSQQVNSYQLGPDRLELKVLCTRASSPSASKSGIAT